MTPKDFVVFIISHGRPDNVKTYATLRRDGYSGPLYIVIDDLDNKRKEYEENFRDRVIVFDKKAAASTTDQGDNFNNLRTTTHARNACFDIAEKLGFTYFLVLDDDYGSFLYRFNGSFAYEPKMVKNLDRVLFDTLEFYKSVPLLESIAFAQGGDFIGGENSDLANRITLKRKCMNSFFCSTERRFKFVSRLNEDVNTYISRGMVGKLFFTANQVALNQEQTQTSSGGMTEAYLASGTYVKSFYTVIYQPSSVVVRPMGDRGNYRLHHNVSWRNTVPMILRENLKKAKKCDG